MKTSRKNEMDAIKLLLQQSLDELKNHFIWISLKDVYDSGHSFYESYNNYLCPCFASHIADSDRMEKIIKTYELCNTDIQKDPGFIRAIKITTAGKSAGDLQKLSHYFITYVYQNCKTLYYHFNDVIMHTVSLNYHIQYSVAQEALAKKAVLYYNNEKFDSLLLIFPGYQKFKNVFKKIQILMKNPEVYLMTGFSTYSTDESVVSIFFDNKDSSLASSLVKYSGKLPDSKIISIDFKREKSSGKPGKVEELRMALPPEEK